MHSSSNLSSLGQPYLSLLYLPLLSLLPTPPLTHRSLSNPTSNSKKQNNPPHIFIIKKERINTTKKCPFLPLSLHSPPRSTVHCNSRATKCKENERFPCSKPTFPPPHFPTFLSSFLFPNLRAAS
ncbi:hypothetical protein B9Z19DRAFT_448942 [Tuber borchii]|uniref:Uncharacterized protein n=1 Tax=Tuber borchii TaxID=42251 RepID=A0A2T7A3K0_TUBBO|nr:hypothetical protein B9Z19DRAFT_448942 [Tuber borchii]